MQKFSFLTGSPTIRVTVFAPEMEHALRALREYNQGRTTATEQIDTDANPPFAITSSASDLAEHVIDERNRIDLLEREIKASYDALRGADKALFQAMEDKYADGVFVALSGGLWQLDYEEGKLNLIQREI